MEIDENRDYPVYKTIIEKNVKKKVYSDHNSIFISSNWFHQSDNTQFHYTILSKGYKEFREQIEQKKVSLLLEGKEYQKQYDTWSKEIEGIAKSVTKKKKCKARNVSKWMKVKRTIRKSLQGKLNKDTIQVLKRRLKLLDQHIEEEKRLNRARKIKGSV